MLQVLKVTCRVGGARCRDRRGRHRGTERTVEGICFLRCYNTGAIWQVGGWMTRCLALLQFGVLGRGGVSPVPRWGAEWRMPHFASVRSASGLGSGPLEGNRQLPVVQGLNSNLQQITCSMQVELQDRTAHDDPYARALQPNPQHRLLLTCHPSHVFPACHGYTVGYLFKAAT